MQLCLNLQTHGLQHTRPPCQSPTLGAYSNSCPLSLWLPSNQLILCHANPLLPSSFPSIRVFSNESVLHIRWPKYCGFSLSISPSNEHSGLISFRMDWLDLLVVQGTLKSLLQHCSSKTSMVWLNGSLLAKMSLLFNMLSRLVITCLPRSKCLLISWLQSPSAVISELPKIKVCHCFHCFLSAMKWWD